MLKRCRWHQAVSRCSSNPGRTANHSLSGDFNRGLTATTTMSSDLPPYRCTELGVEERLEDLLSRMTLEEKIDQLHQGNVGDTNPNNLAARSDDFRPTYGSYIIG